MHMVNPSGVNFTNKYLTWFRCLGLEDHGLGEGTNGGKKAARAAKRALFACQFVFRSAKAPYF